MDGMWQKNYSSKLLQGYTLPIDPAQESAFTNTFTSRIDTALVKLLDGHDQPDGLKATSKNKKVDLEKLLANYAIVDDDALALQLSVEKHAKVLHELTKPSFCLLCLRLEKLAGKRFDITENPLHPTLLWYSFRETYELILPSKYDRKSAVRYWTQLLTDDEWLKQLADAYTLWLNQLNQWLVSRGVLPYATHEDVRTRFLRKEQEREQAQHIRNDVISSITGKAADSDAAQQSNEIYQQLSQLIKNYKPAAAMEPHLLTGNKKSGKFDHNAFTHMIRNVDALSISQMPADAGTGYLLDTNTDNLAQTLANHTGVNNLAIDKRAQTTIALLSMIFAQLKNEENIAEPIKALMSGLQIPVLDTALKDEQFFTNVDNPAQQLVGEFARVGTYWSPKSHADNDIVYKKMLAIVEDVQQRHRDGEEIFEPALQELFDFIDHEEYKAALLSERAIEAEQAQARSQQAREMAQTLIAEHVGDDQLPLLTSKFISEHWQQVLFFNLNQNPDIHTDTMQRAINSLDQLIAAAKGDSSIDLYQLLVGIRNQLLENGSDFPERQEALRNLFLELKVIASAATKTQVPDDTAVTAVEMAAVDLPLAKKPDTEKTPVLIVDAFSEIVENLHNNVWFKFQQGKNTVKIRLAVILQHSDTYIFINNNGQKVLSETREGVTDLLRSGKLVPMAESAYFDRALQSVVKTLRQ